MEDKPKLSTLKKGVFTNRLRSYWRYYGYKPILDELIFFVTYRCNFRCQTCFYANQMNTSMSSGLGELSIDEIKKISSSMGRLTKLLLSGGEPFLRDDLAEICHIFYLQNGIRHIHLPTNGFATERIEECVGKILTVCPDLNLVVSPSLDGLESTHDEIKGNRGSFQQTVRTIKALARLKTKFKNLKVYIITVVNNKNLSEMVALSEFVKSLPVDGHGPSPMRAVPYDQDLQAVSGEEWSSLAKELIAFHRYWNRKAGRSELSAFLATNRVKFLYNIYAKVLNRRQLPFKCQAGKIISVLEPNGDLRLCELTDPVGNVRDSNYDLKKILFSRKAKEMRKKITDCACTHACFLSPSIKMNLVTLFRESFVGG